MTATTVPMYRVGQIKGLKNVGNISAGCIYSQEGSSYLKTEDK